MYGEQSAKGYNNLNTSNLVAILETHGIELDSVEPSRRLLDVAQSDTSLSEFYSRSLGARFIAAPAEGPDAATHDLLRAHGLPVFEDMDDIPGLRLWKVPMGTRLLGTILHLIRQNVQRYGGILRELSEIHGHMSTAQLGVVTATESRRLIDHFAFAQEEEATSGVKVYLSPPYDIVPLEGADFMGRIQRELTDTGLFPPEDIAYLAGIVDPGTSYG